MGVMDEPLHETQTPPGLRPWTLLEDFRPQTLWDLLPPGLNFWLRHCIWPAAIQLCQF